MLAFFEWINKYVRGAGGRVHLVNGSQASMIQKLTTSISSNRAQPHELEVTIGEDQSSNGRFRRCSVHPISLSLSTPCGYKACLMESSDPTAMTDVPNLHVVEVVSGENEITAKVIRCLELIGLTELPHDLFKEALNVTDSKANMPIAMIGDVVQKLLFFQVAYLATDADGNFMEKGLTQTAGTNDAQARRAVRCGLASCMYSKGEPRAVCAYDKKAADTFEAVLGAVWMSSGKDREKNSLQVMKRLGSGFAGAHAATTNEEIKTHFDRFWMCLREGVVQQRLEEYQLSADWE